MEFSDGTSGEKVSSTSPTTWTEWCVLADDEYITQVKWHEGQYSGGGDRLVMTLEFTTNKGATCGRYGNPAAGDTYYVASGTRLTYMYMGFGLHLTRGMQFFFDFGCSKTEL